MIRANPAVAVSRLARRLGWSERRLQRTFAAQVGIPPKTLARITRVQHAIRVAETRPQQTWASIAAGCGYVDQPHLIREFGQLRGAHPLPSGPSHSRSATDCCCATEASRQKPQLKASQ